MESHRETIAEPESAEPVRSNPSGGDRSPGLASPGARKGRLALFIAVAFVAATPTALPAGIAASPAGAAALPDGAVGADTGSPESSSNAAPGSDFTTLATRCAPSVVEILVSEPAERVAVTPEGPGEDDFARPRFSERSPSALPPPGIPVRGTGSGFIVTADGIIMTSAHVVQAARRVTVRLADDRELDAEIVGSDPPTDIALLKVRGVHLPAATLGNSDDVRVGEWVMAIGSPFGFDHSLRQGIVSAKSRALPGRAYVPFIQTDVAINPGDSGAPLFNTRGEVIGINSQVYSGDYEGLSFAIPSNVAAGVQAQLLRNGKVIRSRLGVTGQEMTQGLADALGRDNLDGVLVSAVEAGGPAAEAGLVPGDVILKLNGREIANAIELPGLVAGFEPGTLVKFDVFREGATKRIYVTLGRLHDSRKD